MNIQRGPRPNYRAFRSNSSLFLFLALTFNFGAISLYAHFDILTSAFKLLRIVPKLGFQFGFKISLSLRVWVAQKLLAQVTPLPRPRDTPPPPIQGVGVQCNVPKVAFSSKSLKSNQTTPDQIRSDQKGTREAMGTEMMRKKMESYWWGKVVVWRSLEFQWCSICCRGRCSLIVWCSNVVVVASLVPIEYSNWFWLNIGRFYLCVFQATFLVPPLVCPQLATRVLDSQAKEKKGAKH